MEIPLVAQRMAASSRYAAIGALFKPLILNNPGAA